MRLQYLAHKGDEGLGLGRASLASCLVLPSAGLRYIPAGCDWPKYYAIFPRATLGFGYIAVTVLEEFFSGKWNLRSRQSYTPVTTESQQSHNTDLHTYQRRAIGQTPNHVNLYWRNIDEAS